MIPAAIIGTFSFGYLGYSTNEYAKFRRLIRDKVDGENHLVDGKIDTVHVSDEYETSQKQPQNQPKSLNHNHLYYKLEIDKGKKRTGSYQVPVQVGKHTTYHTQHYTYTDYTNIFKDTFLENNLKLVRLNWI